jgi:hypothetical protein
MVLKGHPEVDLISAMGPYLDEFATLIDPATLLEKASKPQQNLWTKTAL